MIGKGRGLVKIGLFWGEGVCVAGGCTDRIDLKATDYLGSLVLTGWWVPIDRVIS